MYLRSGIGVGHLTRVYGGILLSFVFVDVSFTLVDCFIVIMDETKKKWFRKTFNYKKLR